MSKYKRRLINYIKNYYLVGCVINNSKIYQHIIEDKASKGRYLDYAIHRMIKLLIENLIKEGKLNPHQSVEIIININEQTTKSNGYYNLSNGLLEELKIINSKLFFPVKQGYLQYT